MTACCSLGFEPQIHWCKWPPRAT